MIRCDAWSTKADTSLLHGRWVVDNQEEEAAWKMLESQAHTDLRCCRTQQLLVDVSLGEHSRVRGRRPLTRYVENQESTKFPSRVTDKATQQAASGGNSVKSTDSTPFPDTTASTKLMII
jgi:hypothetical protein